MEYSKIKASLALCIVIGLCLQCACASRLSNDNAATSTTTVGNTSNPTNFTKYFFGTIVSTGNTDPYTGAPEPPVIKHVELTLTREGQMLTGKMVSFSPVKGTTTDYLDQDHRITGTVDSSQNVKFKDDWLDNTGQSYNTEDWEGRFISPSMFEAQHVIRVNDRDFRDELRVQETSRAFTMEERAIHRAQAYLEHAFTKCDDSYYTQMNNVQYLDILQFRNPTFVIAHVPALSEADRLNGIAWLGQVELRYGAWRNYVSERGWTPWQDYKRGHGLEFNVMKKDTPGFWVVESDFTYRFRSYSKVECSSIPQ